MCFKKRAMAVSMEKAWSTSLRLPSGGDHHGGKASSARYRPAAVCIHESCIAARMAVGQSRNYAVEMAGGSVEVECGVRRGGDGAAGVLLLTPEVQRGKSSCATVTPETESDGARDGGGRNGNGAWTKRVQMAEEGDRPFRRYRGDYSVFLLNADIYSAIYVEEALTKAVPDITVEQARMCYYEAMYTGQSLVTVTDEEHAKLYASNMDKSGLGVKIKLCDHTTVRAWMSLNTIVPRQQHDFD